MRFWIDAACACHTGLIRKSNEDNFLFFGQYLPAEHSSSDSVLEKQNVKAEDIVLAVFDGISGEQFGEIASYSAAEYLSTINKKRFFEREQSYLEKTLQDLNAVIAQKAAQLQVERMGTTVVGLYITKSNLRVFNIGDSRAFLLNAKGLSQISIEDTNKPFLRKNGNANMKPRLIQYLGVNPDTMRIEPHVQSSTIASGDVVLLCSDGLTDMVAEDEILRILSEDASVKEITEALIQAALAGGGKDNITAIVCRFYEENKE